MSGAVTCSGTQPAPYGLPHLALSAGDSEGHDLCWVSVRAWLT